MFERLLCQNEPLHHIITSAVTSINNNKNSNAVSNNTMLTSDY